MKLINEKLKNQVLASMMTIIDQNRKELLHANKKDLDAFKKDDQALYDRLLIDNSKIAGMIKAISEVKNQDDPVNKEISSTELASGLKIINKTPLLALS